MNIAGFLFLLFAHYLTGRGMLSLVKVELKPLASFCFSMLLGIVIVSFPPCVLELMHRPLTANAMWVSLSVTMVIFSIPIAVNFKKPVFKKPAMPPLYEWPFFLVFGFLVFVSVWRCFYFPPYARDMLSGPELIAEYAVREKTMINSVYSIDLQTSNNYFKSPFITCLQIIYKLLVCPFGQLWLSVQFICFIMWIYSLLRERVHPFLAALLMFLFLAMPEPFAYSFVLLYDYSNMIFFFSGFYFLIRFLIDEKQRDLAFSIVLFGFATYIRTETLILVGMSVPLLAWYYYRKRQGMVKAGIWIGAFLAVPAIFYYICMDIFVKKFVPIPLDVSGLINHHLADLRPFIDRLTQIHTTIFFTKWGNALYGYFVYFFYTLLIADLVFTRKFSKEGKFALYGVAMVILGLAFMGYLLPLVDLTNTTKRGLFKVLPLMLLYMANSTLLQRFSNWLKNWEMPSLAPPAKKPAPAPVPVKAKAPVKPQPQPQKKGKR